MPFELRIALRYLVARRKQAFISLTSGIAVLGVFVGVMALVIALALMTGVQGEMRSSILGATAHLSVYRTGGEGFPDAAEVAQALRRVPRVVGASPALYSMGLLASGARADVVTIKGIVPEEHGAVTDVASKVESGSLAALGSGDGDLLAPVLLGHDLAASLAVGVGDVVTLTTQRGRLSPIGLLPKVAKLRVVGTIRTGYYAHDSAWIYLSLPTAQRLCDSGRETRVEVRVDDAYAVREIAASVLHALGSGFATLDWIQHNESLFRALWIEKVMIAFVIGLIVLVAALNIVATLVLMVMEKHKDIAILVSMGASRGAIARIFMLQGTVIAAVGTLAGAATGWAASLVLDRFQVIPVPSDVYQMASSHLPFTVVPADTLLVVGAAVLICFLATIYPSRSAARVDPAEALRYE
jgi:lipoprotein-releasing system permease protein